MLDLNEYLLAETKKWCDEKLAVFNHQYTWVNASEYFPDGSRVHCKIYLQLYKTVNFHITSRIEPHLLLCTRPTGAWS